jgi:Bacterial SH3 domain
MKKCPQCNNVYTDETQFCLNDGAALVEENFQMPTETDAEEDTIIRHDPIIVDFARTNAPTEQFNYQTPQPTIIVERPRSTGKYLLFLIVGLLLGGGLVLATLFFARNSNQADNTAKTSKNQTEKVVISNKNSNSSNNANISQNLTNSIEASNLHAEKTAADDDEFNGRVITLNAFVRSAPSKNATQIAVLPQDDRINIGTRESPNSPWYKVVCEHGTSGWMHGDTIEFTK